MKKTFFTIIGISIGVAGSFAVRQILKKPPTPPMEPGDPATKEKSEEAKRREIAWRIVGPRIEIAQEEVTKARDARLQQVRDFFAEREKRIPAYADRVLSFRSKLELGKSIFRLTDKDAHARFLKEEFSRIIFSQTELEKQITGCLEDYVRDIRAIENVLLVKVRADLGDMSETVLPDLKTEALFRERFESMLLGLSEKAGTDAKVDVSRMIGSEVAAAVALRVAISVARSMGLSGTILAAGGVFGPETLGVSIIVGLIADQIMGWVVSGFYHPEAEIRKKLEEELVMLSTLIVNGDENTRGLKQELSTLGEQRKDLRESALRKMILNP